jgi:hypothetical protein
VVNLAEQQTGQELSSQLACGKLMDWLYYQAHLEALKDLLLLLHDTKHVRATP